MLYIFKYLKPYFNINATLHICHQSRNYFDLCFNKLLYENKMLHMTSQMSLTF